MLRLLWVTPAWFVGGWASRSLGEGPVRVLWTPNATLWLHPDRGEATIDVARLPREELDDSNMGETHMEKMWYQYPLV